MSSGGSRVSSFLNNHRRRSSSSSAGVGSASAGGGTSHQNIIKKTITTTMDSPHPPPSSSSSSSIPRVVTPTKEIVIVSSSASASSQSASLSGGIESSPMVHHPTATHGSLTHMSAFPPGSVDSLRYSLSGRGGGGSTTASIGSAGGAAGISGMTTTTTSDSAMAPESILLPMTNNSTNKTRWSASSSTAADSTAAASAAAAATQTSHSRQILRTDPNACKIFLLLLQPQSKIFELIQLLYAPHDTTIGDLLNLIPSHATESALGSQEYIGLCRPKTQQEILDLDLLASSSNGNTTMMTTIGGGGGSSSLSYPSHHQGSIVIPSAQIVLGEILVAIPKGYVGATVAALSQQILSNPKIVKLLKRADPLAPKRRRPGTNNSSSTNKHHHRRSSHKHRSSSRTSSSSGLHHHHHHPSSVHVLEKHDEVDESMEDKLESERRMQQAMEHAAAEAAATNAACGGGSGIGGVAGRLSSSSLFLGGSYTSTHSATSRPSFASSMMSHDTISAGGSSSLEDNYSQQESLDESFSSWSKSFDASFSAQSASICSGVSKRAIRRKHRNERRMTIMKRCALVGFGLMILMYRMDPHKDQLKEIHDLYVQTPMGATGFFQWAFLLLAFYKMERLMNLNRAAEFYQQRHTSTTTKGMTPTPIVYMTEQRSCPFLKASGRALERFRNKFAKKLKRVTRQPPSSPGGHQGEPQPQALVGRSAMKKNTSTTTTTTTTYRPQQNQPQQQEYEIDHLRMSPSPGRSRPSLRTFSLKAQSH